MKAYLGTPQDNNKVKRFLINFLNLHALCFTVILGLTYRFVQKFIKIVSCF